MPHQEFSTTGTSRPDVHLQTEESSLPSQSNSPPTPAPLQLVKMTIRRFRSIFEADLIPINSDLTILTGENDGGKSAFIDAVQFLLSPCTLDNADHSFLADEQEPIEVEGHFCELGDPERRPAVRVRAIRYKDSSRKCEIAYRAHPAMPELPEKLTVEKLKEHIANLNIPMPGTAARKQEYVHAVQGWLTQRPDEEFRDYWRAMSAQEASRLPSFTCLSSSEAPSPAATIRSIVLRESHRLLEASDYVQRLAVVEKNLNKEVKPSLRQIQKKIKEYCRELEAVDIRASFDFSKPSLQVQLYIRRQGQETDLEKSGEGRRRRVMLAIHEANLHLMQREAPLSTSILAYDEPDTHLDYNSQRTLFDILSRQANIPHVQVLVTTHSLNFIDRVSLQSLLHFRLSDELTTEVEILVSQDQGDEVEFLASVCAGLGLRNSVLLDERCFLVVEGETEDKAIPSLFRLVTGQSLAASGVTLLHLTGYGAARRLIEILVCEWNRDAVLLVDSDSRPDRGGNITDEYLDTLRATEGKGAFFVGMDEFEDAFPDRLWLQVLRQHFPPTDGSHNWTISELTALRGGGGKYGESLCNLVRRRCKNNKIGKPEIGFALARTCKNATQVPKVLRDCFNYARNIATGNSP